MKKLLSALLLLTTATFAQASILITGCGSSEFNPMTTNYGVWTTTVSSTSVATSGYDTDSPSLAYELSAPLSILGNNFLSLTGTLTSATPSGSLFRVYLFDSNAYGAYAEYNWSSFVGGSTVTSSLVNDLTTGGVFNASQAVSWGLSVSGAGQSVSFTFDNISAVPEPTSMLLLGMGLAGIAMRRSLRRR